MNNIRLQMAILLLFLLLLLKYLCFTLNCWTVIPNVIFCMWLLQVYHQERTISKYLYQDGLPEMSEMSLCFWMKLEADDDDDRKNDWLLSISCPGTCYLYLGIDCICWSIQCINNDSSGIFLYLSRQNFVSISA